MSKTNVLDQSFTGLDLCCDQILDTENRTEPFLTVATELCFYYRATVRTVDITEVSGVSKYYCISHIRTLYKYKNLIVSMYII